jgi:O-acetyl-ADP-ribose deacetylase (regulator of RNase III)/tellurite resistance protein
LLWTIYTDNECNAEARKYLTGVILVLGSILTFITYSYIPFAGIPIIGVFTTPVAGMVAMLVSLVSLDFILSLHGDYLLAKYPEEFESSRSDITELSIALGKNWETAVGQTQALLNAVKDKIDPNGNYNNTLLALINALITYLREPENDRSLSPDEINRRIVTEGLPPLVKYGGSVAEGALAGAAVGAGAHGAAAGVFVKAGLWAGIKAAIGMGGGIIVGAPAYAGLVFAAPAGLGAIAAMGVVQGAAKLRDEGERRKFSAFSADVLIAALPMAWVDGHWSSEEKDTFERLLLGAAITEQDSKRVREAMKQPRSFDEILHQGLLKEEDPRKKQMKYRLLLCTAYEIAKADGVISDEEINLHNRMAKIMNFQEKEVHEIRRLILLKSGIDIHDRVIVIQGNIVDQPVEAIVNSTNPNLQSGNPLGRLPLIGNNRKAVDAAIFNRAGSGLQKECQGLGGCSVGEAKLTGAYNLPARQIIHTVSPIYQAGDKHASKLLAECYRESLKLARRNSLRTIAFPALGTGTGKFPIEEAATIALDEIKRFISAHLGVELVRIVCADEATYQIYSEALERSIDSTPPKLTLPAA